jgi:hypothetical protein
MYYLNPIHTRWAFDTHQITKIFYICVSKESNEYDSAVKNSNLMENELKNHSST